jgi:predicted dehydrogenase
LTINHQRRFAAPYRKAKGALDAGRIGALQRIEIGGGDLYDYGTHLFDMCGYVVEQTPVEWVLGQVDARDVDELYGLPQESQGLLRWRYESGVDGLASTGELGLVDCEMRLVGETGAIEIGKRGESPLRVRRDGDGWRRIETGHDGIWRRQKHPVDRVLSRIPFGPDRLLGDPPYVDRAIADVVEALSSGRTSELDAENALQSTEIVFAGWESARRNERIEVPLEVEDNPFRTLVDARNDGGDG